MTKHQQAAPTSGTSTGEQIATGKQVQVAPLLLLERTAGIQLHNRFIWLALILALYLIAQLSFVQWHTGTNLGTPRFDTMDLMAILLVIIEGCLLACALLLVVGTPGTRMAWYRRYPAVRFSYVASGIGGILILILLQSILLLPVLFLHRYPDLQLEGINIPLMLLQRSLLTGCVLSLSYSVMLLSRHVLRLPWWLAGIFGAVVQMIAGWSCTYLSFTNSVFIRLNDVFFYNQLWKYIDRFPRLDSKTIFHKIEMPYFGYYLGVGVIAALFALILWLPRASTLSSRDNPPEH